MSPLPSVPMTDLPILDPSPAKRHSRFRRLSVHGYRVALFIVIILTIGRQHQWFVAQQRGDTIEPITIDQVLVLFPKAVTLGDWDPLHGGQTVLDGEGKSIGFVVQTLPEADDVIGFSGPTNTMVGFGGDNRIVGFYVLRSGDTREHTRDVVRNQAFMNSLNGLTWQAAGEAQVDAVSGATLTSMAIVDGIHKRLGGADPASRFPEELSVVDAKAFFPAAARLTDDPQKPSMRVVLNDQGAILGRVLRTSPVADAMMGYQGPTDTIVAVDDEGLVVGAAIRGSFDNEPYVRYVKEDEYFWNTFKGFTLDDIAELDIVEAGIEGVSGATKTSTNVAEALIAAAGQWRQEEPIVKAAEKPWYQLAPRDAGTIIIVLLALVIAMTHLRGKRMLRVAFQVALVVYLGFINADMVSQALLVGWARSGVAWEGAPGLVLLTVAALACPIFTGRQVYCTHLCPFGALQDWTRRVPLKRKLPARLSNLLKKVPAALLLLVVAVAMLHLPISLVGIEPFDAFVFRIAGWATLTVATVGLVASLFVPMAYCHYGCPTGGMLRFLRYNAASGRLTATDLFVTALTVAAVLYHIRITGAFHWS
ncbi:MAG: FMN-binding protein [Pirellulaceae bacterium]